MTCPEMSDFAAWISLMPPDPGKLIVKGKVVTNGGNLKPRLAEHKPQGINPQILLLELTIEQTGDVGTGDVAPRDVRFEKPAKRRQYSSVEILFQGERCQSIDVTEAH